MLRSRALRFALPIVVTAAVHTAWLASPSEAWAQRSAQDLVARGRSLFDDQQYEESIQTLSAALLRPNNTKQQRVDIYRLLALNYITLNRKDEAESAVRGLLALQPDYALPANESPRFRDFFSSTQKKWEAEGRPGVVKETEAQPEPVTMQHVSPSQVAPGTEIPLSVKLDDPQGRVYDVKLFFRPGSLGKFTEQESQFGNGVAKGTIPGASFGRRSSSTSSKVSTKVGCRSSRAVTSRRRCASRFPRRAKVGSSASAWASAWRSSRA